MASLRLIPALPLLLHPPSRTLHLPYVAPRVRLVQPTLLRRRRGATMVTRAASASAYVFAIMLPVSLLAVTIFTSMRIADRLDEKFLQELEINEAIRQAYEDDNDDDGDGDDVGEEDIEGVLLEEVQRLKEQAELPRPRTRDRPKRQA